MRRTRTSRSRKKRRSERIEDGHDDKGIGKGMWRGVVEAARRRRKKGEEKLPAGMAGSHSRWGWGAWLS